MSILSFQLILVLRYLSLLVWLLDLLIALLKSTRSSTSANAISSLKTLYEADALSQEEFREKSQKLFKRL